MVAAAAERGFSALACTDTNGGYGAVEFQRAAEEAGLRPILGAHLVLGNEECVALAMDERGWGAICRAVTAIHWSAPSLADAHGVLSPRTAGGGNGEAGGNAIARPTFAPGARRFARLDRGLDPRDGPGSRSARWAGAGSTINSGHGPAALSARRGAGPSACTPDLADLLAPDRAGALILSVSVPFLERLVATSGPVDVYAELRPGKERHAVLAAARRLGIPPAVTNAAMFAHPEDWARHRLLRAIALNTTLTAGPLDDATPPSLSSRDAWLKPAADLGRHFPDVPDALDRAGELAERCRYRIPIGDRIVPPRYAETTDSSQQLRALAYEGAARRYGTIAPVTRNRLEHELAIIGMKGFADYFLVVKDIVEHGPTHCGRGSVANSIVSYCLGITHVEPLGAGLLFERFLNPERKDPPDIDLDFPWDERDHILAWVFRRYPMPRAAMVANHNTFKLRGALREVAKVHGRPAGEIREVTRRMPWYSDDVPVERLLADHPNFTGLDLPKSWLDFAKVATPLIGTPRHLSLHPGGVVIVPGALTDYVAVEPAVKRLDGAPDVTVPVIQFEKDGAEDAGLVKIDLLGNRSLAVIRDGIAAVAANTGRRLDYTSAEAGEDPKTRELFRTGRTMGVFYTESPASRLLCIKSGSEEFELLVLNTSIIRPASNRFIRLYLTRLHGAAYEPLHPSLRDVLAETFGVMVYQEDVVNVSAAFAGMPLATADGLQEAPGQAARRVRRGILCRGGGVGTRPGDIPAGVGDGALLCRLQLLQGPLLLLHPGGAAVGVSPGPLSGGVLRGGTGQRRRVLRAVRVRGGGPARGGNGAAAGCERQRIPDDRVQQRDPGRIPVRERVERRCGGADRAGPSRRSSPRAVHLTGRRPRPNRPPPRRSPAADQGRGVRQHRRRRHPADAAVGTGPGRRTNRQAGGRSRRRLASGRPAGRPAGAPRIHSRPPPPGGERAARLLHRLPSDVAASGGAPSFPTGPCPRAEPPRGAACPLRGDAHHRQAGAHRQRRADAVRHLR
jgi:hypothetical protein